MVYTAALLAIGTMTAGTAHCANMYPESPEDPDQLKRARLRVGELVQQWVRGES